MATLDPDRLSVFSLNCWGIRYLSKHCSQRYTMLAELLSREAYDIILLQEVWSERDYLFLKQKLGSTHPHSHYFKSGVIGSGLATFSKHRIHDAFLYCYSLNGYPYMVQHGDWFGGKAVAMVILEIGTLKAHVYLTHLHAEYSRERDSYLPHRVVQAWELQHFIRHTSMGADVVILGGDLNMHPQDLGTRLLLCSSGLRDCYTDTSTFDGCEDGLTLISDNCFINKKDLVPFEKGIRIDYILIKGSSRVDLQCESMSTTQGSVPNQPHPYSDHEALSVVLRLGPRDPQAEGEDGGSGSDCAAGRVAELVDLVMEARTELKVGLHCAERRRHTAARTGVMGVALLLLEAVMAVVPWLGGPQPFPSASFYLLGALGLISLLVTGLLYIFYTAELKALQGAEEHMRLAVGSLQERLRGASKKTLKEEGGGGETGGEEGEEGEEREEEEGKEEEECEEEVEVEE